ncbi:hypothetical protein SAMN06298216_0196 [Spirosomataceae bacterium TFI 002]|nr:hypothetical protein SAMN06298216_0196 [Spirosomataceae bacterium TFI 002]
MKQKLLFLIALLTLLFQFKASSQIYPEWSKTIGSPLGLETISQTTKDDDGNTYVIGIYLNTIIDGELLKSQNESYDIYVAKYDSDLSLSWIHSITSIENDFAYKIFYFDGHIYLGLRGGDNLTFSSNSGKHELELDDSNNLVFAKYSAAGDFVFSKILTSTENISITDLKVNVSGIYLAGWHSQTSNFGTIAGNEMTYTATGVDGFIANYALDGTLNWVTRFENTEECFVHSIALNTTDIFYAVSFEYFYDIKTLGSSKNDLLNNGLIGNENAIGKLNLNGEHKWAKRTGDTIFTYEFLEIQTDGSEIYLLGNFIGTTNFNSPSAPGTNEISSSPSSSQKWDLFIAKYDTSGVFNWVNRLGGIEKEEKVSLQILDDQLLIGGISKSPLLNFSSPYVAGKDEIALGGDDDGFLAFYTKNGRFINAHRMGGVAADGLKGFNVFQGRILTLGYFTDSINFNSPSSFSSNLLTPFGGTSQLFMANYDYDIYPSFQKGIGSFTSGGAHESHVIVSDDEGNMYVTGYFSSSASFGNVTLQSQGAKDIFIVKYDANGNKIWAKRAGGAGDDEGNGLVLANGFVYLTGSFEQTANFSTPYLPLNLEITSAGNKDIFLAKYAISDGAVQFIRRAGSSGEDEGKGICFDGTNIYITGKFNGTANFNTPSSFGSNELISAGMGDAFIAKYNTSGQVSILRRAGGTGEDIGRSIDANQFTIYVGGSYEGIANFNTPSSNGSNQLVSAGEKDAFIWKIANFGTIQWAKRMGGLKTDEIYDLSLVNNDCYVTGFFTDSLNFQNNGSPLNLLRSEGLRDIFVAKFNSSGNLQWSNRAGGTLNDVGTGIKVNNGIVYTTGIFRNSINFNTPSAPSSSSDLMSDGERDFYTALYNTDGDFMKVKRGGGAADDICFDIDVKDGIIYTAGTANGVINFNTPSNFSSNVLVPLSTPFLFFARSQPDIKFLTAKSEGTRDGGTNSPSVIGSDSDGNIYVAGLVSTWVDFKIGTLEKGQNQKGYILKMDRNGNNKWVKPIVGNGLLNFKGISISGNQISIFASFKDSISFSNNFESNVLYNLGSNAGYILSIDTSGTFLWHNKINGNEGTSYGQIKSNGSNIYVGGSFSGTSEFSSQNTATVLSLTSNGPTDFFLASYSNAGNILWAKNYGGVENDILSDFEVYNNQIFVTGNFDSDISFSNNSTILEAGDNSYADLFILSFDTNGNNIWSKRAGSDYSDFTYATAISVSSQGVFILGKTGVDTLNFAQPNSTTTNRIIYPITLQDKLFLTKYSLGGNYSWAKGITSTDEANPEDLVLHDGNLVFTVQLSGELNYNSPNPPGPGQSIFRGIFGSVFTSYDFAGNYLWSKTAQNDIYSETNQLLSVTSGLFSIGENNFNENYTFDQSHSLLPFEETSIVKFVNCGNTKNLTNPIDNYSDGLVTILANETNGTITASNKIIPSAQADFQGKSVLLTPGFEAQAGTVFLAKVGGCH